MLICSFLFVLAWLSPQANDPLDSIKSKEQIVANLKDLYRTYQVNHVVDVQKEDINLCFAYKGGEGLNMLLSSAITACSTIQTEKLANPELKSRVADYVDRTVRNYRTLMKDGPKSDEFKKDYTTYKNLRTAYLEYVLRYFTLGKFILLTKDEYARRIDKKNYVESVRFEEYQRLKRSDFTKGIALLGKLIKQTQGFQEKSIYEIELADNYVKHPEQFGADTVSAYETAVRHYKAILDKREYSLYLFEAWAKWRSVLQKIKGSLRTSEIPNGMYETTREEVAGVILRHISKDVKDEMAINQFFVLATHEIIARFGAYGSGNKNSAEFDELFSGTN